MRKMTKQTIDLMGWTFFTVLTLSLLMITTSCGKKDGNRATTPVSPNPTYDPNCPNCTADGTLLGSALGFNGGTGTNYKIQLGITLSGSAGTSGILGYSGPVTAVGAMSVKTSFQFCPMPVGTYTVATTSAGQWDLNLGGFRNLVLEARHTDGTIVKMHFLYGLVEDYQPNLRDDAGRVYPYGLIGDLIVDSVNSTVCVAGFPGLPPLNQFFLSY